MDRPLFIDTDTASDDAVALMMAFQRRNGSLLGVGVVAGNVPLLQAVQNALFTRELCEVDTPVYAGAAKPLMRPLETAQHVHGQDGMGDIGLPVHGRSPDAGHAALALIDAARAHQGELELVTLGPLTNIALALSLAPDIATKIRQCVIMGGTSDGFGNITPVAEFNVWADPEAAQIVFASDLPKVMMGWDVSRKYAALSDQEAADVRAIGTEKASVAIDAQCCVKDFCSRTTKVDGFDLPDPIAMAAALDPSVIRASLQAAVSVVPGDGPSRGMTIVDDRSYTDQAHTTTVALEADREIFMDILRDALR